MFAISCILHKLCCYLSSSWYFLFLVYCFTSNVYCLLLMSDGCCWIFAIWCLLFPFFLLFYVWYWLPQIWCLLVHFLCWMFPFSCWQVDLFYLRSALITVPVSVVWYQMLKRKKMFVLILLYYIWCCFFAIHTVSLGKEFGSKRKQHQKHTAWETQSHTKRSQKMQRTIMKYFQRS